VTVEVAEWSHGAAALTIRPSRRPPHDAYYAAALAAVEALALDVTRRTRELAGTRVPDAPLALEHWRRAS
jgi:hypothetical protein